MIFLSVKVIRLDCADCVNNLINFTQQAVLIGLTRTIGKDTILTVKRIRLAPLRQ